MHYTVQNVEYLSLLIYLLTTTTTRNGYFTQLPTRIDSLSFFFRNNLPLFVTNSPTLGHFCNNLDKYTHLCTIICTDFCTVINIIILYVYVLYESYCIL